MVAKIIAGIGTFFVLVIIVFLAKRAIREKVGNWFKEKSWRIFLIPTAILALNFVLTYIAGNCNLELFGRLAVYLMAPTLLIYFTRNGSGKLGLVLLLFTVLLWLPVEFRWILKSWKIGGIGYPLTAYTAIVFVLMVMEIRKIDLKFDLKMNKGDWKMIGLMIGGLSLPIIPITLAIGFTKLALNPVAEKYPIAVPIVYLLFLFAPALAEEIIFRGLIQNVLGNYLKPTVAIITSSLIFGFAHINNKVGSFDYPNWHYVCFATLAGLAYGYIYWRRQSLTAAVVLHASVDFIWWLILRGV
ncbi:MAG: membrane protein [Parcubacteria group bacterium Gr01-1014_3]|nr:MAG: membrane protein [Parcubacteria group bacterium Gr01-1014_3]